MSFRRSRPANTARDLMFRTATEVVIKGPDNAMILKGNPVPLVASSMGKAAKGQFDDAKERGRVQGAERAEQVFTSPDGSVSLEALAGCSDQLTQGVEQSVPVTSEYQRGVDETLAHQDQYGGWAHLDAAEYAGMRDGYKGRVEQECQAQFGYPTVMAARRHPEVFQLGVAQPEEATEVASPRGVSPAGDGAGADGGGAGPPEPPPSGAGSGGDPVSNTDGEGRSTLAPPAQDSVATTAPESGHEADPFNGTASSPEPDAVGSVPELSGDEGHPSPDGEASNDAGTAATSSAGLDAPQSPSAVDAELSAKDAPGGTSAEPVAGSEIDPGAMGPVGAGDDVAPHDGPSEGAGAESGTVPDAAQPDEPAVAEGADATSGSDPQAQETGSEPEAEAEMVPGQVGASEAGVEEGLPPGHEEAGTSSDVQVGQQEPAEDAAPGSSTAPDISAELEPADEAGSPEPAGPEPATEESAAISGGLPETDTADASTAPDVSADDVPEPDTADATPAPDAPEGVVPEPDTGDTAPAPSAGASDVPEPATEESAASSGDLPEPDTTDASTGTDAPQGAVPEPDTGDTAPAPEPSTGDVPEPASGSEAVPEPSAPAPPPQEPAQAPDPAPESEPDTGPSL